jgi:hypothetical protein
MGHHYVPRRYLRNFQCEHNPGWIWIFDRKTAEAKCHPIKAVAQSPRFYTEETERWLAFRRLRTLRTS